MFHKLKLQGNPQIQMRHWKYWLHMNIINYAYNLVVSGPGFDLQYFPTGLYDFVHLPEVSKIHWHWIINSLDKI